MGAKIAASAEDVFAESELIVKVKEPQPEECARLKSGQVLFTYLHLAADKAQTEALQKSGATCIAYETVTAPDGSLPLLTPMSEVAGRMSVQVGAYCLQKAKGGRGVLLGGVPGVPPGKVVVLGWRRGRHARGGNGGRPARRRHGGRSLAQAAARAVRTLRAGPADRVLDPGTHRALVIEADLVIGAVLIPGAAAPRLVTRDMVKRMKAGSVLVDIAIDQGGCFETSRPTTHAEPDLRGR